MHQISENHTAIVTKSSLEIRMMRAPQAQLTLSLLEANPATGPVDKKSTNNK